MPLAGRILEGLVTTCDVAGRPHLAPMGPIVDESFRLLHFRPYQTSTTFQNLVRTGVGVLHVTDDVELLARAAVGQVEQPPEYLPAQQVQGWILSDCSRWYEFQVESIDDSQPRSEIVARVIAQGQRREFFGFNRAMHAVVEGAILATRVQLLPWEQIDSEMKRLAVQVQKTAGPAEARAFAFLEKFFQQAKSEQTSPASRGSIAEGTVR